MIFCMLLTAMLTLITPSDDDINLIARIVMNEASIESFECKEAIAVVILNRVESDKYPDTIEEVIFEPNQFCTSNSNGEVTEECYEAVKKAIKSRGYYWPINMLYFRTGYYHEFATDYTLNGSTYFSTDGEAQFKEVHGHADWSKSIFYQGEALSASEDSMDGYSQISESKRERRDTYYLYGTV